MEFEPPQATTQSTAPKTPTPSPGPVEVSHPGKKLFVVLVSLAVLVFVGIGGVFAYKSFFSTPSDLLNRAMLAYDDMDVYSWQGRIDFVIRPKDQDQADDSFGGLYFKEPVDVTITAQGYTDTSAEDFINSDLSVQAGSNIGDEGSIYFDLRTHERIHYIRLGELDVPVPFDLSFLINTWIEFDTTVLDSYAEGYGEQENVSEYQARAEQAIDRFYELIQEYPPFIIAQALRSENIGGSAAYHVEYAIDIENVKQIARIMAEESEDRDSFQEEDLERFDDIRSFTGQAWIDKKTHAPVRITGLVDILLEQKGDAVIEFDFEISDIGVEKSIEIPENTKTVEELMEEVFAQMLGSMEFETADFEEGGSDSLMLGPGEASFGTEIDFDASDYYDTEIDFSALIQSGEDEALQDSDFDGLTDGLESLLGTDPYNSDTDGDGFSDKEEVDAGYDPLQ
jgi:hypothetical protein